MIVGPKPVASGRLVSLDHVGDHRDVVLELARRSVVVADEPLLDVAAVVHPHQRTVQGAEAVAVLARQVAILVVVRLVQQAEVVADLMDEAGHPRPPRSWS